MLLLHGDREALKIHDRAAQAQRLYIHNRSSTEYVYNVELKSLKLAHEMLFDSVDYIKPNDVYPVVARWEDKSSITTRYADFFHIPENRQYALRKRILRKKPHNRGIADSFWKIPMSLTYEGSGGSWKVRFNLILDFAGESFVEKVSWRRV